MIFIIGPLALDPDFYWKNILKKKPNQIIALDGGIENLLKHGLVPDIWVGDMDSSSPLSQEKIKQTSAKILTYPKDKDYSDFELAVQLLKTYKPGKLELYGMLGGRLDHMLFNIEIAKLLLSWHWEVKFCSFNMDAYLVCGKTNLTLLSKPSQTVSMIPLDSKAHITASEGLKYPLQDEELHTQNSRGLSNVCMGSEVTLNINEGKILVLHYKEDLL